VRVGSRAAQDRAGGVLVQVVTGVTVFETRSGRPIEDRRDGALLLRCVPPIALEDNLHSPW
jgi:hypothetical protein